MSGIIKIATSGLCAAALLLALAAPTLADLPTAAVCKSFAKFAIRWNS